jgi:NADH-quinone oxidoreductase subunit K
MAIELLLLAVNYWFVMVAAAYDDSLGLVYTLIVLTVAAAESAIGLAILVVYYRLRGYIDLEYISLLKG